MLTLLAISRDPDWEVVIARLLGQSALSGAEVPLLTRVDAKSRANHASVVRLVTWETRFTPNMLPILRTAALDAALAHSVRPQRIRARASHPRSARR